MGRGDLGEGNDQVRALRRPIVSHERTKDVLKPTEDRMQPGSNHERNAKDRESIFV